ncbi:MAG: uroporphyrinogen decarboxylase family protein [Phycisphaerales bacterium]
MSREFYLEMAKTGLAFPIGADLVLKEYKDHHKILNDGVRLGHVIAEAARRFKTPLAVPVMDLMLEKALMLRSLGGISEAEIPTWHFKSCPTAEQIDKIRENLYGHLDQRLKANVDAIDFVSKNTDLVPVGMSIGPFSLMTKLLSDPITPVYMAGMGLTAENDPEVKTVETLMDLAVEVIMRSFKAQADAGAKAFFIAEPAANKVYISPKQMETGSDIFERMVMKYLRKIKAALDEAGIDLIFHCCGELTDEMLKAFCSLKPTMLSLGSSRKLWEDAAIIPKDIVLYGNLPSKKFYCDDAIKLVEVKRIALELNTKMKTTGHPFILGTECDVLSVDGCCKKIMTKAMAIVDYARQQDNLIFPSPDKDAKIA